MVTRFARNAILEFFRNHDHSVSKPRHAAKVRRRRRNLLETLERRDLLAGDMEILQLELATSVVSEADGATATQMLLTRTGDTSSPVIVTLTSDDTSEATVPASVTILAGSSTAMVDVDAVDDSIADGTQMVTLTGTATGYTTGTAVLEVTDDDTSAISLSLADGLIDENGGSTIGTVSIGSPALSDLTINLTSDDPTRATVPSSVTVLAGNTTATFTVSAVDNGLDDGDATITVTAASDLGNANATLVVVNDDFVDFTFTLSTSVANESDGFINGHISLSTPVPGILFGELFTSDSSEAVPVATVPIVFPATSITFPITIVDDGIIDGTQTATISLQVDGKFIDEVDLDVTDNDGEIPSLTFSDSTPNENDGTTTATLSVAAPYSNDVTFTLSSDDTATATVPTSVLLVAGQTTVNFPVTIIDDLVDNIDDSVTANISAVPDTILLQSVSSGVTVADDEVQSYSVTFADNPVAEGVVTQMVIELAYDDERDRTFIVSPQSSEISLAEPFLSKFIPAGDRTVSWDVIGVDELVDDGDQTHQFFIEGTVGPVSNWLPDSFADITVLNNDHAVLDAFLSTGVVAEEAGGATPNTATGTVVISIERSTDLVVDLSSSEVGEALVPASVTIPAGSLQSTFIVSGVADNLVDGTQTVSISAASDSGADAVSLDVADVDSATLSISTNVSSFSENGGSVQGTVSISTPSASDTIVSLSSSDIDEAIVPASVTILAGSAAATFSITGVDENIDDGDRSVIVSGSSIYGADAVTVSVTDDDTALLSLSLDASTISEEGSAIGTVSLNASLLADLTVDLTSTDTGEATVPASITISAGDTFGTFNVSGVTDGIVDGTQVVSISADGAGVGSDSAPLTVTDVDFSAPNNPPVVLNVAAPDFANKASAGVAFSLSGVFDDADLADTHSVTVDWGDGTASVLTSSEIDQSGDTFSTAHTYTEGGIYNASVTVDDGTDSDDLSFDIVVTGTRLTPSGTLQIIGSSGRDRVRLRQVGQSLRVRTRFGAANTTTQFFALANVNFIQAHLCDGNDRLSIRGTLGVDMFVDGGEGNDDIETGNGNDLVIDLSGDNVINVAGGDDSVSTGDGNDVVLAGSGNDEIGSGAGEDFVDGQSGDDSVNAGDGGDRVYGGSGADVIRGGRGDDRIFGGAGDDILLGGAGRDRMYGNEGTDLMIGGTGADRMFGQSGGDLLIAASTDYDNNDTALRDILNDWSGPGSYIARIASLQSGVGAGGTTRLIVGVTVHDDGERDLVFGGTGADWYFASQADRVFRHPFEIVELL